MKYAPAILLGSLLSVGAHAADLWAGAAGGVDIGAGAAVGGVVEVGTQDDYFGFSADLHVAYDAVSFKPTYAVFANLRLQLPVFLHPYAIAGIGAGNDVPMVTQTVRPLWKLGAGIRFNPVGPLFVDAQAGVISLNTEYLEVALGLKI